MTPTTSQLRPVDRAVQELGKLPILDRTLVRVQQLARDPESSVNELVSTIDRDPNLAVNVLRLANCAQHTRSIRAQSLRQAVNLIGRTAIGRLATEAAVVSFFERVPGNGHASRGQLHVHALQVANCATALAEHTGSDVDAVHLAALLHDIGKLVLPLAFGSDTLDRIAMDRQSPSRAAAERAALGCDHAWAGGRCLTEARVPDVVIQAVALHHGGDDQSQCPSDEVACVQIANTVVALATGQPADQSLLTIAMDRLGLDHATLSATVSDAFTGGDARAEVGSALAERIGELEREARTDDLTGALSRRYWMIAARERIASGASGAIMLADIDFFKKVNDEHGHQAGDVVLGEVARVLSRHGLVGRLGGDEFMLLLSRGDDSADAVAERVLADIAEAFACDVRAQVTISLGIAPFGGPDTDLTALMQAADAALYDAKSDGRGRARRASTVAAPL